MRRVILLGASNLTYGFPLIVESLRASLASPQVFAAHGHGRSYGRWSRVLGRRLPGIRECGVWDAIADSPVNGQRPFGLITDVGNDLLYGADPQTILAWVEECVQRLRALDAAVSITGIPLESVKRMSAARYHATRLCFFPARGPSWAPMRQMIDEIDAGLRGLAGRSGCVFIEPQKEWYGLDPIHVRRSQRMSAWGKLFSAWPELPPVRMVKPGPGRAVQLWRLKPALRTMNGRTQAVSQPVLHWDDGMTVSLY